MVFLLIYKDKSGLHSPFQKSMLFPMIEKFRTHWRSLLFFLALIAIVQGIGNVITIPNIQPWYNSLNQPFWRPPNALFGPVWTMLYLMLAYLGWRLWIRFDGPVADKLQQPVLQFYFIQLVLNFLWSPLFFGLHLPGWALLDLSLILLASLRLAILVARFDRPLAMLLLPYLGWLSFAFSLNAAIVYLN